MRSRTPASRPALPGIGTAAAWLVLFIGLLKVPATGPRMLPPQSWELVLGYALQHHLQWGRDIVYTFGPLGFLGADYYWGNLLLPTVLWGIWFALVMAAALMRLSKRVYPPIGIALLILLLLTPPVSHFAQDVLSILAILVLALDCLPDDDPPFTRLIVAGMTFAVLSQIKFTFFVFVAFSCVAVCAAQVGQRRWKSAAMLATSIVASFLVTRFAAGQQLTSLPDYLRRSWQGAHAYDEAMSLECSATILAAGVALAVLMAGLLCWYWFPSRKNWIAAVRALLLGAAAFLVWKEAYIRADNHVLDWFIFAILFVPLIPVLLRASVTSQRRGIPIFVVTILISIAGMWVERPDYPGETARDSLAHVIDALSAVAAPPLYDDWIKENWTARKNQKSYPAIRTAVGNATVGILSIQQDLAAYLDLNYAPHPVFQNYAAYTPEFQRLNEEFFNSNRAPDYVLWAFQPVDNRYPTMDDGALVLIIPRLYTPVLAEGGIVLWKRIERATPLKITFASQQLSKQFGDIVAIGTGPYWLQVDVKQTWLGRLRSFFYHPAQFFLEVQLTNQGVARTRLVPGNASFGFLLQPCVATPNDLLQFSHNGTSSNMIYLIRVATDHPECFAPDVQLRLSTIDITPH